MAERPRNNDWRTFDRLTAARQEQTPQALARLAVTGLFAGLWFLLWLVRLPMPVPFLLVLLAEICFFLLYLVVVGRLPSRNAIRVAQYFMLAAEIIFHTTIVYFLGTLTWLGSFAYVFGLIFSNAFLDLRRGMIYTAGAAAAFSALILLEATGVVPHYAYLAQGPLRYRDPQLVATTIVGAGGVFFSIHLWASWVGRQLRGERDAAVRAQDSLIDARLALQTANAELEERVRERTAELESANAALREKDERLTTVIENTPVVLFALDCEGVFTLAEGKGIEVMGLTADQIVGRSALEVYRDLPDVYESIQQALSGTPSSTTVEVLGRILDAQMAPLRDAAGDVIGVIGVSTDVTERTQAQEALRQNEALLRETIESTADGILVFDRNRRVLHMNQRLAELWRIPPELLAARDNDRISSLIAEQLEDPEAFTASVAALRESPEYSDILHVKDGRVYERLARALTDGRQVTGHVVSFRDITERKHSEDALRESETKFRTMAETVAAAVFIYQGTTMRYVNSAAEGITGYKRNELLGMEFWDVVHPDMREMVKDRGMRRQRGARVAGSYEVKLLTRGGREKWVDFTTGVIEFEGTPAVLGTAFDITERKRAEEALRQAAMRDPLTGVLNHAAVIERLKDAVAVNGREGRCAVAMVDVDGLKATNDTYGHPVGDQVLLAIAKALSQQGAFVGRYGGDEFIAILPDASRADAQRYRRAVLSALEQTRIKDPETGTRVPVVASLGVAIYPEEADTVHELIGLADSAMYTSRRERPVNAGDLRPARNRALHGDRAAQMVGEIVPLLTSPGDLNDKLRLVGHRLSVGAGYDGVNFALFQPEPGPPAAANTFARVPEELVEAWDRDQRQDSNEPHPIRLLFERAPRPVILHDPWNDDLLLPSQRELLRAAEIRSVLVAPMVWQNRVLGSLGVGSKRENAFAPRDAQFVGAVATQVTAIVRMATLVDELQSAAERLAEAQTEAVLLLAAAAEAHDEHTGRHLQRVRALAEALALELGYAPEPARELGLAAVLHDIGKIRVPDNVLTWSGALEQDRWELMKHHTTWGNQFLEGRRGFELAATIARCHHERWDGGGYPEGLAGGAIPEAATIVAVADSFDAMVNDRPYRAGRSVRQAVQEVVDCSGKQFSPKVVAALLRLHKRRVLNSMAPRTTRRVA